MRSLLNWGLGLYGILWSKNKMEPLLFYVINEHTDDIKYCEKKHMKPYNVVNGSIMQYEYKGYIYDILEQGECYSGYMVTLMRLPKLSFGDLLNVALESKNYEERIGAIGVILKDYQSEFEQYLLSLSDDMIYTNKKNIKRLVSFICILPDRTSYVLDLPIILNQCEKIKSKLDAMKKQ